MQIKWLEDFAALAQARSFSRAAELRHVTHPAFGRRIKALEAWAGTPLIERDLGDMRQLVGLIAVVTQALVLLSIIASLFMLFRLLMPQFVTLRALGAPRSYVFAIAWGFTSLLIGAGVVFGLAGGYLLSFAISAWLAGRTGVSLEPTLGQGEFMLALVVFAIGLALATLPAWRVQREALSLAMKKY